MGNLDVRIRHGAGGGIGQGAILALVAAVVVTSGGGAVAASASGLTSALATFLTWLACAVIGLTVTAGTLAIVFRRRIRRFMVRQGDPNNVIDDLEREKRAELARIRAMRLQIEAARIAGVEITPDMLRIAEDPELAELVWRFKAAANGTDRWLTTGSSDSSP